MRAIISVLFGVLFIGSVATGAVVLRWSAQDQLNAWDAALARRKQLPIPVRTVKIREREVAETIGGTAVTLPRETAIVSFFPRSTDISDRLVQEVNCRPGDFVHRGERLFRFAPDMFEATVAHRKTMLSSSSKIYGSLSGLRGRQAISEFELIEAEQEVSTARYQLQLAEYDLQNCELLSPITGIVEAVAAVEGMRITGEKTLATIHDLNPIHIQMDFPMGRMDALRLNQSAEIVLDAFPQEVFRGTVVRVAPTIDTRTRILPVTLEIPNPDHRIRAGISGYVRIRLDPKPTTSVPKVAIIQKQRKSMVFCVEDGRAQIREIAPGPEIDDEEVQVEDGLELGDEVVVYGHDTLRENDVVNVNWLEWTQRE